jgi:hypothetical protein
MTWATALDRLNGTVRDTFPAAAVHTPVGGVAQACTVVHDFRWLEVAAADGQTVSAQRHTAFVRIADLSTAPAQGDTLTISDGEAPGNYEVVDVQRDGGGGATLVLFEAVSGGELTP